MSQRFFEEYYLAAAHDFISKTLKDLAGTPPLEIAKSTHPVR